MKNVLVILGGPSTEHIISLRSGWSVINNLNTEKYNIYIVGINKQGQWHLYDKYSLLDNENSNDKIALKPGNRLVYLDNLDGIIYLIDKETHKKINFIDIAFPVLHGAYGEDGVIQGLFRGLNLAFVGVDIMASSVGMDKEISKKLWNEAGIPIADYIVVNARNIKEITFDIAKRKLGLPIFVKPANAGSSVGVHKVNTEEEFHNAIRDGLQYDRKLLIEEAVIGTEVECAILGNDFPEASVLGGVKVSDTFYSFETKYISATGADKAIPLELPKQLSELLRATAIRAFLAIGGEGLSRVDFFLRDDHTFVINEINTFPGFTSSSMYPKLWAATGVPYSELLDKLIHLGFERHKRTSQLKTSW